MEAVAINSTSARQSLAQATREDTAINPRLLSYMIVLHRVVPGKTQSQPMAAGLLPGVSSAAR